MALWGNKDQKSANSGTIAIAANGLVTGTSTVFDDELVAGEYLVVTDTETKYRVTSITNNTACQVVAQTLGGTVTAVDAGNSYSIQQAPIYISASRVGTSANDCLFVDATEAGVSDGPVVSLQISDSGSGYNANATATIAGAGSSATANAEANSSGRIATLNLTAGGTDYYDGNTTVTIAAPAAQSFNALTAVSNTADTITLAGAGTWAVGDQATYAVASGNTAVGGLVDGTTYFVSFANSTVIALAATEGGANIDLTAGTSETGHTLTGETATGVAVVGGANPVAHSGWNLRTVGTGGRAGRVSYETLVAMGTSASDAGDTNLDDNILPDS